MKQILLYAICMFISLYGHAQQGTIDLSKDPAKQNHALPKSNAQLLKETSPQTSQESTDLSEQYKPDAANSGTTNSKGLLMGTGNPGNTPATPQMMNTTNTQYNIGNGTKANSTIYYDDAGKVRSSGTSIQFGKKNK